MFAILPTSEDFIQDDAEWFTDLEQAYDSALNWSVELDGGQVNIYESYGGKLKLNSKVFA